MHTTPPLIDHAILIQLRTPTGLIVQLMTEETPSPVREAINKNVTGSAEGDTQAAIIMARLSGLDTTIRRTTQTTVHSIDIK